MALGGRDGGAEAAARYRQYEYKAVRARDACARRGRGRVDATRAVKRIARDGGGSGG